MNNKTPIEDVLKKPNTPAYNKLKEDIWILYALSDCIDEKLDEINKAYDLGFCPIVVEATKKAKESVAFFDSVVGWDNADKHTSNFERLYAMIGKYAKNNVK